MKSVRVAALSWVLWMLCIAFSRRWRKQQSCKVCQRLGAFSCGIVVGTDIEIEGISGCRGEARPASLGSTFQKGAENVLH